MNARIKELIKQAGGFGHDDDGNELTPMLVGNGLEKLARLLINDCLEAIKNESMGSTDEWEDGLQIAVGAIIEHFGVE